MANGKFQMANEIQMKNAKIKNTNQKEGSMEEGKVKVEVMGIKKLDGTGKTKAFVDISINDAILIKGFRVVDGNKGLFIGMPGRQGSDGKWYNNVSLLDDDAKDALTTAVLGAYENEQA